MLVVLLTGGGMGCRQQARPVRPIATSKPAVELKKGIIFALEQPNLPADPEGLALGLAHGISARFDLPKDATPVQVESSDYPHLQRLVVDLSGATPKSDRKPAKMDDAVRSLESGVHVDEFQFTAQPLMLGAAAMHVNIEARKVDFGLVRDKDGRAMLLLTDAAEGSLDYRIGLKDLGALLKAIANEKGAKYGLFTQRAEVKLISDNERQLSAEVHLRSLLLLVPVGLRFTAQARVDEAGNCRLSNLTCEGDDVAGALVTQIIRPGLARFNNRTMPLISFPSDGAKLRDVNCKLEDDAVHISAAFGS